MKLALALASAALASRAAEATNFVIIQPDDMAFYEPWNPPAYLPWTGGYPGKTYPSGSTLPNINRLLTDGMYMTNAYAASPKCGTSRYSTVTGRYASRSSTARKRAWQNQAHPVVASIPNAKLEDVGQVEDGQDCSVGNVAQVFKKNGYTTGMVGKWHLTKNGAMTIEEIKAAVVGCGFDDVEAMYPDNIDLGGAWAAGVNHNMEYVAYKAVEFITDNQNNDWFLYVNPTVPHSPDVLTSMDADCRVTVDGDFTASMTTGWNVVGMTDAYSGDCVAYRNHVKTRAGGSTSNRDLGSIWLDDAIGAIYQTLVSTGQLQDTVILFQLDHGLEEKDRIWEGGTRIPQFIHWPAGNLPSTFEGLVSTIDIAPSLLDIAGILNDPASTGLYSMDGKSWKDAVYNANGEGDDWIANRCLFFESNEDRAIRCGCDKYMQLGSSSNEATVAIDAGWPGWEVGTTEALFDLCDASRSYITASPSVFSPESSNIIESQPQKATDLAALMACHLARTNALSANTDTPDYSDCEGDVATPSPAGAPTPLCPVANNGGVPQLTIYSPWVNDLLSTSTTTMLTATVLDDDIDKVRFNIRYPNSTMTGFNRATEVSACGHQTDYELQVDTSLPGKYGMRINVQDHSATDLTWPLDGGWIEFIVADTTAELVAAARAEIASIIQASGASMNLAAKFVRHGFHDCVGGCDGCVDLNNPDNSGLDIPIAELEPVVNMFARSGVTRADIWALAALEGAGGSQPDGDPDNRDFTLDWIGRPNCEDINTEADCQGEPCRQDKGPVRNLPSPSLNTAELLEFFGTEFGFDARDTVAIMGAHTLGVLARENSGYDGPNGWLGNTRTFGNGYYSDLVGGVDENSSFNELMDSANWEMVHVDNSDLRGSGDSPPDRWQWQRGTDPHFVMVNSDMALVRNLDGQIDPATGQVANCQVKCNKPNQNNCVPLRCPHAQETLYIAAEYKGNNAVFLQDFEDAFKVMLNKGIDTSNGCLSPPCLAPAAQARRSLRGQKN